MSAISPGATAHEATRAARRRMLAALRLSGVEHPRDLARALHVSERTVRVDLEALMAEWRREAGRDFRAIMALDLARTEHAILQLAPRLGLGDPAAVVAVMRVLDYRAKLLGLYATKEEGRRGRVAEGQAAANMPSKKMGDFDVDGYNKVFCELLGLGPELEIPAEGPASLGGSPPSGAEGLPADDDIARAAW